MTEKIEPQDVTKHKSQDDSVEDSANIISHWFFIYLNPLFDKGVGGKLEHVDLGPASKQDRSETLYKSLALHWEKEKKQPDKNRSLWRCLWGTTGYSKFAWAIVLYGVATAESFGPIMILNYLVKHFQGTIHLSTAVVGILVALLFVLPMTSAILIAHSNILVAHIGVQFRNALINMIYRKALKLSPAARQKSSTGQIVNMFSNDTSQIQRFLFLSNNLALSIPTIIVCLYLIYVQVGVATFVGLALIIIVIPLNSVLFNLMNSIRRKKVVVTDSRVKLMNEVLNGIRIIKYYAWEGAFQEKVAEIREKELKILQELAYIGAVGFAVVLQAVPVIQPILIFLTYISLGNSLDSATAFTTISLFNIMLFPFVFLPLGLSQFAQSQVSITRMLEFFDADELSPYVNPDPDSADGSIVVSMSNANLGWVPEAAAGNTKGDKEKTLTTKEKLIESKADVQGKKYEKVGSEEQGLSMVDLEAGNSGPLLVNRSVYTLSDISFQIKKGQLVAVVGSVGSGKSSFLNALLGEMHLRSGNVRLSGSVAYCDQRPWILNETVQGNITFGEAYDEEKFDRALFAANLEDDIAILSGGIQTQIGERGINLSGGQKARVALARAVYRDADVYLLDDPLSAVDAHVGQFLFHECIQKELAGKTRILVTHQVHILQYCDMIIVLEEGKVKAMGSYDEILSSGIDVSTIIPHDENKPKEVTSESSTSEKNDESSDTTAVVVKSKEISTGPLDSVTLKNNAATAAKLRKQDIRSTTIISKEDRKIGDVTNDIYLYYIRAGGVVLFSLLIIFVIVGQLFTVASSYWLQYWGTISARRDKEDDPLSTSENLYFVEVFAVISILSVVFYGLRSYILANHRFGTSRALHDGMLTATLYAPVAFFDTTPVGRVLNRFSSDLLTTDEEISQTLSQFLNFSVAVLGSVGAIAGATKGTFLILAVPLMFFYNTIQKYFRGANTTVARLESVSRSPIYADFSQALNGVNTIRAYDDQKRFITELETAVNNNTIANVTQQLCSQWLAIRLDFIGALISFFIALIAACAPEFIPAGFVAVGLSYSFQLTTFLKYLVRTVGTLEAQMSAVERIKQYMDTIEIEGSKNPELQLAIKDIPPEWPKQGIVEAKDLSMRYRDGPLVLSNISFKSESCEKIGVVGRTGSGKSSLMIALFRMQELASGTVYIDSIDISRVPVQYLRRKLGIIPQDPVMFSVTVRFNLDPFNEFDDATLWSVLESVNMADHVKSMPKQFLEEVAEGGDNFSVGQRQLICIARAILRKPKILVLDEATASIDNETDALIQRMIRTRFQDCTVLTIAHRLNTIIDSDRIMVLNAGNLVELDVPTTLLDIPDGHFYSLWQKHLKSHGGSALAAAASPSEIAAVQDVTSPTNGDSNKPKDIAL